MPDGRPDPPIDEALIRVAESAAWHRSPGYRRFDNLRVGPHEYILLREDPRAFEVLRARILSGPGGFVREYGGRRYRYVILGGYKYWTLQGVVNRERLPDTTGVKCQTCEWRGTLAQLREDKCPFCGREVEPL